jgi:cholesterol transport system auxiliary component
VRRAALVVVASAALASFAGSSGCALTSKNEVIAVRYFTPEQVKPRLTAATIEPDGARASRPLLLGRVTSGSNLRERIAFRNAAHEIGYYEDLRWTERPETYVRRELGRTLFEERGFERSTAENAPELDVEVLAFDELRLPQGARVARVELKVLLWDGPDVLVEETFTVDRPVPVREPRIEDFVAAMAAALDDAATQVATRVATALAARGAPASRRKD